MPEAEHKDLLREAFDLHCYDRSILSEHELVLLSKYGAWLSALSEGRLTPVTDAQRNFVLMCEGQRTPVTEYERLWHKYIAHRIFERSGVGDYFDRAEICGVAAQLGSERALAWLEVER